MNKIAQFLLSHVEDILILAGLSLIVVATFLLSFIAGVYATGIMLLGLGVYFVLMPIRSQKEVK